MFRAQRIRDPVHDIIVFRENEFENTLWEVLGTRPFQRLRRIKQLGFSDFVYPGASHSRFAHSVGAFHIARRLMQIIEKHLGESRYLQSRAHAALAAALVHDVGHGPFSHAFEGVSKKFEKAGQPPLKLANHEEVGEQIIRQTDVADKLVRLGSGFAHDVATIIRSKGPGDIYSAVVSSQFDADRLDYLQRDRCMSGTQHGAIDFEWLLANIQIGEVPQGVDEAPLPPVLTFVIGPKAIHAAETFVLGLFQMYPTVYFHKTTRGAEKLFTELVYRLICLIRDGSTRLTGLPVNHPLVRFGADPDNLEKVLALDDTVIWGALTQMAEARDATIKEFARRLRDRKLYKAIDVREAVIAKVPKASELEVRGICDSIHQKVDNWLANHAKQVPSILSDQERRPPYKEFQESKGPVNQIMVKTGNVKELKDLRDFSVVVRSIETFHLDRLYTAGEDTEAREFIESAIEEESQNSSVGVKVALKRKSSRKTAKRKNG